MKGGGEEEEEGGKWRGRATAEGTAGKRHARGTLVSAPARVERTFALSLDGFGTRASLIPALAFASYTSLLLRLCAPVVRHVVVMGFLTEGDTLPWDEAQKWSDYIREHGITQFLHIYRQNKARANETLFWGDEVRVFLMLVRTREALSRREAPHNSNRRPRFLSCVPTDLPCLPWLCFVCVMPPLDVHYAAYRSNTSSSRCCIRNIVRF